MGLVKHALFGGVLIMAGLAGCQQNNKDQERAEISSETENASKQGLESSYVSPEYEKRDQGFDWMAVLVRQINENEIKVSVRSRSDKKKPSCTFDVIAKKLNNNTYQASINGKTVLFLFQKDKITIDTKSPEGRDALRFYCSGGASMAGVYSKIAGELDTRQLDKTTFSKFLELQNTGFRIVAKPIGNKQELIITPSGLSEDNSALRTEIAGEVTDAEIEDLNADGFPEVLVYSRSGENNAGTITGVSVNNGKSMSFISFPDTYKNVKINTGYYGYDEFSIVENLVSQRFPIFENGKRTGKMRQVDYQLLNGENSRELKVKNVREYPQP